MEPSRRVKQRARKTVLNEPDNDDGVSLHSRASKKSSKVQHGKRPPPPSAPRRTVLRHDLFETKPPAISMEFKGSQEEEDEVDEQLSEEEDDDDDEEGLRPARATSSGHKRLKRESATDDEVEVMRRTQLLCNAWAQQKSGLTFTDLLKIDVTPQQPARTPRLSIDQLPKNIRVTLNADFFETTKFKLTRTGTYQQILTESEAKELAEASPILRMSALLGAPANIPQDQKDDEEEHGEAKSDWIEGSISMAMPEDAEFLNKIQQWIRQNVEYFSAERGDRKGISRGRVGIRCIYCRDMHTAESESYPGTYNGIHTAISQKFMSHFRNCSNLPGEKRNWFLAALRDAESFKSPPKPKQFEGSMSNAVYTKVAARRIGLIQLTHDGLRFSRDLSFGALPMETVQVELDKQHTVAEAPIARAQAKVDTMAESLLAKAIGEGDTENSLSRASDKSRCSDYLFLSIRQADFCHATEAEAFQRRKRSSSTVFAGFTGFCCRWCKKKRVFPSAGDGIIAAILGNLTHHFMNTCEAIPDELRSAFKAYKPFHVSQHASVSKNLRDSIVRDLWHRLRSNDRGDDCGGSSTHSTSTEDDDAQGHAKGSRDASG